MTNLNAPATAPGPLSEADFERRISEPWVIPPPAVLVSRPWWKRLGDGFDSPALGIYGVLLATFIGICCAALLVHWWSS